MQKGNGTITRRFLGHWALGLNSIIFIYVITIVLTHQINVMEYVLHKTKIKLNNHMVSSMTLVCAATLYLMRK